MKRLSVLILRVVLLLGVITISACGPEAKGKKAGKEFCNCIKKGKTQSECEVQVQKKYSQWINNPSQFYVEDEEFARGFKSTGRCN